MKVLYLICFIMLSAGAFIGGSTFFLLHDVESMIEAVTDNPFLAPVIILDDQEQELWRFHQDKHSFIEFEKIPQRVVHAFIAAEDHDFFNHRGISMRGIIRSLMVNSIKRRKAQGASTITQQLVRLRFLDARKTLLRKLKEQLFALIIEQYLTKEQIFQAYVNTVCFGCGIYGIPAASQFFWGIDCQDLSIAQAATLAGIVQAPQRYCPLQQKDNALKRRNIVLAMLKKNNYISQKEFEDALNEPLTIIKRDMFAPHFCQLVRHYIDEKYGPLAYQQGLVVKTTLNKAMQEKAERIFHDQVFALQKKLDLPLDGALLCLDSKSGAVKALVGGFDFMRSAFDRSRQARRQLGSIIKPFLYATFLEQGGCLHDTEIDEPLVFALPTGTWMPRNVNRKFKGPMTYQEALARSNNIIAIKVLLALGYKPLQDLFGRMYPLDVLEYPSLALGCIDISLWKATSMMTIFADQGKFKKPYFVTCVKDSSGKKIEKFHHESKKIITAEITGEIADVLQNIYKRLSQSFQKKLPCQALGKTGTTNDARSIWFIGSTPSYTTGVFLGCDDNRALGDHIYASLNAFPLWFDFNASIDQSESTFASIH